MPARTSRRARFVAGLTVLLLAALTAPSQAAINGFEGADGDQAAACLAGVSVDWACLTPGSILLAGDGSGALDDGFLPGSKHTEPGAWAFAPGKVPDKADLIAAWTHTESSDGRTYLDIGFARAGSSGDTFLGVELNQTRGTWTNATGTEIPCRQDGDVLLSYEVKQAPAVRAYLWDGTGGPETCPGGAEGTWEPAATGGFEAAMNVTGAVPNSVDVARLGTSLPQMTFGEAAIDLRQLAGSLFDEPCEYFRQAIFTTRASSAIDSTLLDLTAASEVVVRSCSPDPEDTVAPEAPMLSTEGTAVPACDGAVVVSGTAEPGSTVTVLDGDVLAALAPTDSEGAWSAQIDAVDEGVHSYSAEATDAAGNTSERSAATLVTVDLTGPAAPAAGASVDGRSVLVAGVAEPGLTVSVSDDGVPVGSTTVGGLGTYGVSLSDVTPGDHTYSVVVTDACGRMSEAATAIATVAADPDPDPDPTPGPTTTADPVVPVTDQTATAGPTLADALAAQRIYVLGEESATLPDCATSVFTAYVALLNVKRVVFRVDGKKLRTVSKPNRYGVFLTKVDPSRYSRGEHRLTGRITLTSGKQRTMSLKFRRCGVCLSRRAFRIHVPFLREGEYAKRAVVTVNGKRVKVVTGKRLRAKVVLTGLPKGTYKVRIRAVTNKGRVVNQVRTYHTCVPARKSPAARKKRA